MGLCACGCGVFFGQAGSAVAGDCAKGPAGEPKLSTKRIGTLAWAKETGGRLHPSQRDAVHREMLKAQARCLADFSRPAREAIAGMDLDAVRIPDSALAKAAESYVSALSSGALMNHLYRTYYWGTLLAQSDKARIKDEELFYVAALLHDLGFAKRHRCTDSNVVDFSVDGGFAAYDFLVAQGVTKQRAEAAAEAIILHMQIVDEDFGAMAKYLQQGAWTDLSGLRASEIPAQLARDVIEKRPALDIRKEFGAFVVEEITTRPDTRLAVSVQAAQELKGGAPLFPWPDRPERVG